MVRIRSFEEHAHKAFLKGGMPGFLHLYSGEEAIAAGVMAVLEEDDYIVTSHRGHGHLLARGGDPKRMFAELYGRVDGYCHGKGGSMHIADMSHGMLGANGIVGAAVNIGTGAAFAAKYRGEKKVSVSFFGDGSTNRGTFHEALNLAAIWELPAVYICENNLYGVGQLPGRLHEAQGRGRPGRRLRLPGSGGRRQRRAGRPRSGGRGGGARPGRRRPHPHRGQDLAPLGPLHRRHGQVPRPGRA